MPAATAASIQGGSVTLWPLRASRYVRRVTRPGDPLRRWGTWLFGGQELLEPGLVSTSQWRSGPDARPLNAWAGVARKTPRAFSIKDV